MTHFVSLRERGQLACLMEQVFQRKPEHGEARGTIRCICGGTLHYHVFSNGKSWAHCPCGRRWNS